MSGKPNCKIWNQELCFYFLPSAGMVIMENICTVLLFGLHYYPYDLVFLFYDEYKAFEKWEKCNPTELENIFMFRFLFKF